MSEQVNMQTSEIHRLMARIQKRGSMNGIHFYKRITTQPRDPAVLAVLSFWQTDPAPIWSTDHFLPDLGTGFTVIDGLSSSLHSMASPDPSGTAARWLMGALEYDFQIDYKTWRS